MNRKSTRKGFTLVETIVVLVILAILAAILVPSMIGWISRSREKTCQINRNQILRYYRYVQALEQLNGTDVKLSDVLAGKYEVCAADVAACQCPDGGTYTADDEKETIACSIHGSLSAPTPGGDSGGEDEPSGGVVNTEQYLFLTGDQNYKAGTWGDLEKFEPAHDGQPGTIIPTGTIFYYRGDYYLFRDNQYFTKSTNIPAFVAGYGVMITNTTFTTPSESTAVGDLKLKDGKPYVFFPYSRFWHDYLNDSCWYEIKLTA